MKKVAVSIDWKDNDDNIGISNPHGTTIVVAPNIMYALDRFIEEHPFSVIVSAHELKGDVIIMEHTE